MKYLKKTLSVFLSILTILSMCSVSMPVFAAYDWKKDLQQIDDHYVQEEFSSKILAEVEELREENTKHFLCKDGSYIATTYSEPVHYKENGEWKEIDNTLKLSNKVKSSSGKAMYVPKSTDREIKIPQSFSDGQKISLTKKGHTISFGVSQDKNVKLSETATVVSNIEELSSNVQPDKAELHSKTLITSTDSENYGEITEYNNEVVAIENQVGAIVYENVFESADLEYVVTTNSIKENIVVYEKQNDYTYKFDMDFGDLVPIVNEDNSIRVVDPETEETVFFVGAPYMYDANDIESTDVDMSLVEESGIYLLTLKASSDWINATERTFPVVIDPIVYLSFDDVFVMNGLLNKNTTKVNKELRVGRNLTNLTRTYIKPNYPTNIPMGSYIDSAYLVLGQDNYYQAPGADGIYINLYDCHNVSSWDPGSITWENQPFYNADNGYVSSENCFLTSVLASSNKAEYNFNITASAKRWLRTGSNDGLMLASSDESEKTQIDFYSSRTSDSSLHPSLSIYYIEPSISATSWETDSQAKEGSLFRIATDNAWTAYSNENWISLSKTSGNGLDYSKIIVTANNSIFDRVGTVTVKMGDTVIGTITVTQYGKKPNLELDTTSLNFNAGSSKQTVNITSNTTWSFSNLPEWITVTPSEGSMDSTVEIEVSVNNDADIRQSNITVTADTVIKTITVVQLNDIEVPAKPDIYEEDGLVYISSRSFDFNEETDSPEHIEYKIENGEWTDHDGEPINIVRTYGAKVYARVRDDAENISPIAEITLENNLGEYTASYTDIALGEGLFPVEFGRTYTSTNGWFFTFDANVVKIDDNAYVFTDFYGENQYFIKNGEGKYLSVDEEELTVNADSYVLTYGEMICTFSSDGKINRIVTDYLDTAYTWTDNLLTITGGATVTFADGKPSKIKIARTDSVGTEHTKEVEYVWVEGNLTRFIDAAYVEHNYAYTNGILTTNETETITYSVQGRAKLISQPNGAFVKYTYNDNATNEEVSNNVGAVTVSDSKGVTDTIYYVDGVYVSNTLEGYSDIADYAPESISNALTQDSVGDVVYVAEESEEDESANGVVAETGETETEDPEDNGISEDEAIDESVVTEETTTETPLYEEIDEDTYAFYMYDNQKRVTAELEVLKENITIDENTTFENAEAVAENKVTFEYESEIDDSIKELISYVKSSDTLVIDEKECYDYVNCDVQSHSKFKYIDGVETIVYNEDYAYNEYGNVATHTETQYATEVDAFDVTYTTSYTYDVWGMCTGTTITCGGETNTTITEYDLNGVTLSVTYNDEKVVYIYTDFGTVDKETVVKLDGETQTVKQETDYTYDADGNLISCLNPDGDTSYYFYDDYGNLTNHNFNGYFFTYNTLGSILTASVNDDILVVYTYEGAEQKLLSVQYANGQTLNYVYDETGELITVKQGEEIKFSYSYSKTQDENVITTLTDNINNIIKVIENDKVTVKTSDGKTDIYSIETLYEGEETEGNINEKRITIGSDIYTFKAEENKDAGEMEDFSKTYEYDYSDNLWKINTANIFSTEYGYNEDKNISSLKNTLNGLTQLYSYTYDDEGNIITENLNIATSDEYGTTVEANEVVNYTYDEDNQLILADYDDVSYEYIYDYNDGEPLEPDYRGNITKKIVTTDGVEQAINYVYDTQWKDKLISYNGQAIIYDAVGNPTEYLGHNLEWSFGRQLTKFDTTSYTYDEEGIRTSKTVDGITTIYYLDETNIIEQITGNTVIHFYYDSNDEVIGFTYNEADYFYVKNAMSDIIGIVDDSGNLITSYAYDAWGKVLSVTGSNTEIGILNPFRYRSYYYDTETEFYYLQSRYYDPEVCRFINSDDVNYIGLAGTVGSYNAFAYCENNPVIFTDPTGKAGVLSGTLMSASFLAACAIIATSVVMIVYSATGVEASFNQVLTDVISSMAEQTKLKVSAITAAVKVYFAHRTLKNGSKKRLNDKHTKPRPGRESEKKKQKDSWKRPR